MPAYRDSGLEALKAREDSILGKLPKRIWADSCCLPALLRQVFFPVQALCSGTPVFLQLFSPPLPVFFQAPVCGKLFHFRGLQVFDGALLLLWEMQVSDGALLHLQRLQVFDGTLLLLWELQVSDGALLHLQGLQVFDGVPSHLQGLQVFDEAPFLLQEMQVFSEV